ncbi:MAG: SEC-C metal-binding domain-containing protein, partial [Patescibacteria group bacterium]|nr:SEC-C metal-binding domain-containing protein [Patescibacteria group bacterium]
QNQVVYSIYKVLAARSQQARMHADPAQAQKLMNALGSGLSALRGLKFSAPEKEKARKTESPFMQSSQSGVGVLPGASSSSTVSAPSDRNRFDGAKVGRNDACPCGSGKKFKRCHGA